MSLIQPRSSLRLLLVLIMFGGMLLLGSPSSGFADLLAGAGPSGGAHLRIFLGP